MSTNLALAQSQPLDAPNPAGTPAGSPRRASIEIVTSRLQRQSRPRIVYALIATAALFVLLLTQLGISIALSHGAYQISSLQSEQVTLNRSQQKYTEKLNVLSSPQNIANNAAALGMVRNQNPVYLDLPTGAVFGTPTAAAKATATSSNLVANSLLTGVPVVTQSAAEKAAAKAASAAKAAAATDKAKAASAAAAAKSAAAGKGSSSATSGAAATESGSSSVASDANQLAAPETR